MIIPWDRFKGTSDAISARVFETGIQAQRHCCRQTGKSYRIARDVNWSRQCGAVAPDQAEMRPCGQGIHRTSQTEDELSMLVPRLVLQNQIPEVYGPSLRRPSGKVRFEWRLASRSRENQSIRIPLHERRTQFLARAQTRFDSTWVEKHRQPSFVRRPDSIPEINQRAADVDSIFPNQSNTREICLHRRRPSKLHMKSKEICGPWRCGRMNARIVEPTPVRGRDLSGHFTSFGKPSSRRIS